MTEQEIRCIVDGQRSFFLTGNTLDVEFRIQSLQKLKAFILKYESEIHAAIQKDLGKSNFESYMCETGLTLSEISYMLKHVRSFAKEKRVHTPLAQFHSRSYRKPSPHGVVLIMSPWNYPFLLTIEPLVDAIAAGNTVVIKPSAYSPNTSAVIYRMISECFSPEYVSVITGGRAENTCLLGEKFDYIFFTGSQSVGKEVMKKAAEHLTPVTLELGGKSPCIVEKSANLKLAAKRIVFGKYLNCGQTCVAPDYIYCDASVKDALLKEIRHQIRKQFGKQPLNNANYGNIINEKHFQRICSLIDPSKVVVGGETNPKHLRIAPTVMDHVTFQDSGHAVRRSLARFCQCSLTRHLMKPSVRSKPCPIRLLCICSPPIRLLHRKSLPAVDSVVAASTIPLSIWPPAKWDLADLEKVAWALTMEKTDLILSAIIRAS